MSKLSRKKFKKDFQQFPQNVSLNFNSVFKKLKKCQLYNSEFKKGIQTP